MGGSSFRDARPGLHGQYAEPSLPVILYWRPGAPIEKNDSLWTPGEVIQDSYPVYPPQDLPPATYRVRVGLYFLPSMARFPVRAADRPVEGEAVELAQLDLQPKNPTPNCLDRQLES